jgi:hypothetical protein
LRTNGLWCDRSRRTLERTEEKEECERESRRNMRVNVQRRTRDEGAPRPKKRAETTECDVVKVHCRQFLFVNGGSCNTSGRTETICQKVSESMSDKQDNAYVDE